MTWQLMETAPRDGTPILGWCVHEADPYVQADGVRLTVYGGHVEHGGVLKNGPHAIVWGGGWDDRTPEDPNAGHMPDWWFQYGSDFEIPANPICWKPIESPQEPAMSTPDMPTVEDLRLMARKAFERIRNGGSIVHELSELIFVQGELELMGRRDVYRNEHRRHELLTRGYTPPETNP